jgi:hypothetical protein
LDGPGDYFFVEFECRENGMPVDIVVRRKRPNAMHNIVQQF